MSFVEEHVRARDVKPEFQSDFCRVNNFDKNTQLSSLEMPNVHGSQLLAMYIGTSGTADFHYFKT